MMDSKNRIKKHPQYWIWGSVFIFTFFFFWPIAFLIAGLFCIGVGVKAFKEQKLMYNTATSRIRSLAVGHVEIKGRARASKYLRSPMTQSKCVYYSAVIEEYKRQGKSSKWVPIATETKHQKTFLKDDTGKVEVDLRNANLMVSPHYTSRTSWTRSIDEKVLPFLRKKKINPKGILFDRKLRFTEYIIEQEGELYVMGTAQRKRVATGKKNADALVVKRGKNGILPGIR